MYFGRTTLSKFLIQQLRGDQGNGNLAALLVDVAAAIKAISVMAGKGELGADWGSVGVRDVGGATRLKLDALANETILRYCEWGGLLAGMVSEEMDDPYVIPEEFERGPYLLVFNALDRSSNIDVNVSIGSVFSVLRHVGSAAPTVDDFLQPGSAQVASGYAVYGPATMMVLTVGKGTHGFTLDRETGNFLLTHPDLKIPEDTSEFAINAGKERYWEPPVQRYVRECKAGKTGVRTRDFHLRWNTSLLALMHRTLLRGGTFMSPRDVRDPKRPARLRLIHEANPLAFLAEQSGGRASTGRERILDIKPDQLHQRVPAFIGSRNEVERIARYHQEFDTGTDKPYVSPLFNERSLFRPGTRAGQ